MNTKIVKAYGTHSAEQDLELMSITRRLVGKKDVEIEILYCGVCHSDLHTARSEWGATMYPNVPGHEIIGKVVQVGNEVNKFSIGDIVGVGCIVDSCRECESCKDDLEQYCEVGHTQTYDSFDTQLNQPTFGGYAQSIVVDQDFVLHIPKSLDLKAAAPLLCAGITTYSPLRHANVGPKSRVGIVGIGGLGHMAVKLAKAMGAYVVVITTSASKVQDAMRLGADKVVLSTDKDQMKQNARSLDFILDCVSAQHNINRYLNLLKRDGKLTLVGAPEKPLEVAAFSLIMQRINFSGSLLGGIKQTQEMLDFCAEHQIHADVELINIDQINEAFENLLQGKVKYRYVIDMASLNQKLIKE
ncbi:NAD(P)-dependent alcohol dehydrogenase [Myroides sp. LJL115]